MKPVGANYMRFEFATANRIIFGAGSVKEAGKAIDGWGKKALLVLGKSTERASNLIDELSRHGIQVATFHVTGEPTVDLALEGVQLARDLDDKLSLAMCLYVLGNNAVQIQQDLGGLPFLEQGLVLAREIAEHGLAAAGHRLRRLR